MGFPLRFCWDRSTPSLLTGGLSECCCMKCWLVSHRSTEMMRTSCLSPSAWILPITLAGSTRRPRTWSSGSVSHLKRPTGSRKHRISVRRLLSLISGFLQFFERDPTRRLGIVGDIRLHPFFKMIDWPALERREVEPPFKPKVVGQASQWRCSAYTFFWNL